MIMTRVLPVLVGLTLLGSAPSRGQTAPALQVTVSTTASGAPVLVVRNAGANTVTAFALAFSLPVSPGAATAGALAVTVYDAATQSAPTPILPGREVSVPCPAGVGLAQQAPQVQAILFGDGSSWGDGTWVQNMTRRRAYMLQRLTEAYQDLTQALSQGTSRGALVAQFQSAMDTGIASASDPADRACIRDARYVVLLNLRVVVQHTDGTPVPTAEVVQHEMSELSGRLVTLRTYGGVQ